MIVVHIGAKAHKPKRKDGHLHVWMEEDGYLWALAYDTAEDERLAALVAQRHVFLFEPLEAEEKDRLRKLGKLVELDHEAYDAFFGLLACLRRASALLPKVAEDAAAWELLQQFAAALQQWTRTWPPGEPTRAGFAAVRKLANHVWLPLAWVEVMRSAAERTLPSHWTEAAQT